jgi:hypothetical protein
MIYAAESDEPTIGTPEFRAHIERYVRLADELRASGVMLDGRPLDRITTATTVRVRDGETLVTDGPFAETKEQLGGFFLVECADLDEAIACAERIPSADFGSIEIRPILDLD